MNLTNLSLRQRILFVTASIVVGVVAAVMMVLVLAIHFEKAKAMTRLVERTNSTLTQQIADRRIQLNHELGLLADRPGTKTVYQTDFATISDHLKDLKTKVGGDWLLLYSPDGKLLGSSDPALADPKAIQELGVGTFPRSSRENKTAEDRWQTSYIAGTKTGWALMAIRPIEVGGYIKSRLAEGIYLNQKFASEVASSAGVKLAIYHGESLVASNFPSDGIDPNEARHRFTIDGQVHIGARARLAGYADFSYLAMVPEADVAAPFQVLLSWMWGLLALSLFVAVWCGRSLAARVVNPLGGLIDAAQTVRAGSWPDALPENRSDEIGLLQSAFNQMASSLRSNREKLLSMLQIDPLTELWNYRTFREKLATSVAIQSPTESAVSVILLDIDGFEDFNASFGAERADDVLKQLAALVPSMCTDQCVCARYGGNEFAIATTTPDPEAVALALRATIERETAVTVSVGFATWGPNISKPDLLLLAASSAVKRAKQAGRNRVRAFDSFEFSGTEDELRLFLQDGSYAAVRALAEAVDAKDEYTRGHSQRVADYAKGLAQALGHDSGFVELVYVTGTLHDVGKIGVPDAVLKKAGKLEPEEFEAIKRHPELGEKIVSRIPQLSDALPGIRHHHERWDGRGYPDGIEGEQIPLIARILAVADTYDAMTSDRPYRKGLAQHIAFEELRKGAGSQFDSRLVEPFIASLEQSLEDAA